MKFLVVEDEIKTAQMIKQGLEEKGYSTDIAHNGEMALELYRNNTFDLIITDIRMPKLDGVDLCRIIRAKENSPPIIMLTALGMTMDKITGFDAGADDYIVKPFEFEELLARVKAILKRTGVKNESTNVLTFADLVLNIDSKEVTRAGKKIQLTAKEFMLLQYFIKNKGRVISKAEISENVWDINFDTGTNVVEVYVNYLRNKVDKDFGQKLIHTRIGMGYVLKEED